MEPIIKSTIFRAADSVQYASGSIVSKVIIKQQNGNVTLFAFDKGQALSEHSAPFDALVQAVEGEGEITIDKKLYRLKSGDMIIMPANIPHAVNAIGQFKMMLVMVKG